jgi:hypothetical protein
MGELHQSLFRFCVDRLHIYDISARKPFHFRHFRHYYCLPLTLSLLPSGMCLTLGTFIRGNGHLPLRADQTRKT